MHIVMPSTFPENSFKEFTKFAGGLFPRVLSDEYLEDPFQKQQHFQNALLAVYYRYRACSELNESFKTIYSEAIANQLWLEWSEGEEHHYQLDQCIYNFFMNALSVFDSLAFCLYFVGGIIDKKNFQKIENSKQICSITLKTTIAEFKRVFPNSLLTTRLDELSKNTDFVKINKIRNILAHRLIGRRNVYRYSANLTDGTRTDLTEETLHISDLEDKLIFDNELIEHHFDDVTSLLTTLILAAVEFVKSRKSPVESDGTDKILD